MPGSIRDVLPAAAALLGADFGADRLGLLEQMGPRRTVVVMLIDGMGLHLLPALTPHAPLLAAALAGPGRVPDELECGFPSTTPTSLVSLGTGAEPGAHGILGFTVRVPATAKVLTHIAWRDDPDPATWAPVPTWFARLTAAGYPARAVLPELFVGSGLTRAAYGGASMRAVPKGADYTAHLLAEVQAGPGLVYGYLADLDTAAHVHGIESPHWFDAAAWVDALLTRIVERLPSGATLLVTADHGGLNVAPGARVDLGTDPRLGAGLDAVAGEPRVRYLHVVPGACADVLAAWRDVLGDDALVLERDDTIDRGLFGPVPDAHRARIGDVVVICTGRNAVLASGYESAEYAKLIGYHGGLRPEETAIPLLAWSAESG